MGQKFLVSGKEEDGVGKAVYIPTTHKTTHYHKEVLAARRDKPV